MGSSKLLKYSCKIRQLREEFCRLLRTSVGLEDDEIEFFEEFYEEFSEQDLSELIEALKCQGNEQALKKAS